MGKKKEETIKLYRAEEKEGNGKGVPDWVKQDPIYQRSQQASGRWFTEDLEEARWYITNEYPKGKIVMLEIPKNIANRYRVSQLKKQGGKGVDENPFAFSQRPEEEYFLPRDIANQKKDYIKNGSSKKEKGLAMRVSAFILFVVGGIILNLNLINLTGNVVSKSANTSSNLLGILLIIAGATGIFLSLKKVVK